jgi:aconitate hydratase
MGETLTYRILREHLVAGVLVRVDGVRVALEEARRTLLARTDAGEISLRLSVSEEERAVLLAGGLMAHLRDGGRPRIQEPQP